MTGPPGEAEVLMLNPQRQAKLLAITGWGRVEPGTLNIECADALAEAALRNSALVWREEGTTVIYPPKYAGVPKIRRAYLYYRATLVFGAHEVPVLVRRAENPVRGRVEVFAEQSLRASIGVVDGSTVVLLLGS